MSERFSALTPRWVSLASHVLGWLPDTFWNATPDELSAALHVPGSGEAKPLTRSEFEHLIKDQRDGRHD